VNRDEIELHQERPRRREKSDGRPRNQSDC
jgi:hypothetical protein